MSNPWAVRHAEKLAIHAIRPTERNATCLAPLPCRLGSTSHASLLLHPATSQAGLRLEMVQLSKDSIAPVWGEDIKPSDNIPQSSHGLSVFLSF